MNRTLKSILQDIDVLGIKGGYDVEQLLTPNDCRILKSEIERLNNRIDKAIEYIEQETTNCDIYCDGCTPQHCHDIKKILDILKGNKKD